MMTPLKHAECLESTADAIRRCVDGVPDGFRLEYITIRETTGRWSTSGLKRSEQLTTVDGYYYRLVPIPTPRRIPHTRETWPGYPFIQSIEHGDALVPIKIGDDGISVHQDGSLFFKTWENLARYYRGGHSHLKTGPWEPLSQVVTE